MDFTQGHPEDDLNEAEVAKLESFEEAGIKGKVYNNGSQKEFKRESGGSLVIYPMLIKKLLDEWPEKDYRERRLVTIKDALSMVTKKEHLNAIDYFSTSDTVKKIKKQSG